MATQPLIIKEWANGVGDSPNVGVGMIRNATIDVEAGAIQPNYLPVKLTPVASSSVVTFDSTTDLGTITGTFAALQSNVAVTITSTGTMPGGLTAGTVYWLIAKSATTFKLATCIKNCGATTNAGYTEVDIDITSNGTGTITMVTVNPGLIGGVSNIAQPDLGVPLPNKLTFYTDTNNRVWYVDAYHFPGQAVLFYGNTLDSNYGNGIGSFQTANVNKRYVFTYHTLFMDVGNISSIDNIADPVGNSSWTLNWQVVAGQNNISQYTIVGDDNIMYFVNGRTIGSLQEIPGQTFAPGTSSTYTFNQAALTLPQGEIALWLEQLGIDLLIAGGTYNNIYPWDRTDVSFGLPIKCAEIGVFRLKNINNTVYVLNGIRGNIYKTQGAIVTPVRGLPQYLTGTGNPNVNWGGIGERSGNLLLGVNGPANTVNDGVWMLYPDGRLTIDNQPSSGAGVATMIGGWGDEFYTFGYNGGIDIVSTGRYGSFGTVFQSALYGVANKTEQAAFSRLELQLTKPTTQTTYQIRVSYRTSLAGAFTVLATFTTDATNFSFSKEELGLINLQNIQVQVEMTGQGSNVDALQLFELRLYP